MPGFVLVTDVGAEGKISGELTFEGANDPGEVGTTEVSIHGSPSRDQALRDRGVLGRLRAASDPVREGDVPPIQVAR